MNSSVQKQAFIDQRCVQQRKRLGAFKRFLSERGCTIAPASTVDRSFACISKMASGPVADALTLSQTTNFRVFQTAEFADDNFKFDENGGIVFV